MSNAKQPNGQKHVVKRCPECLEYLQLDARICHSCKTKVGDVTEHGMAEKPTNWLSYLVGILAVAALVGYLYWLFFLKG